MKALTGGIRRLAKVGLLASVVAIAALAPSQDGRPASASHTEILFSSSNTSPIAESSIVLPLDATEPTEIYVWAKGVDDPTGAAAFELDFEFDSSMVSMTSLSGEMGWLGSTGRSGGCPSEIGPRDANPHLEPGEAFVNCFTFMPPPPYGPGCSSNPPRCDGLLATVAVQAAPEAVTGTIVLDFVEGTVIVGTPPDPGDIWDSVIPTTLHPVSLLLAPCADFDGDGTIRISDVLYVILNYRSSDPDADLDGNGMVLITDVLIVIAEYRLDCVRP